MKLLFYSVILIKGTMFLVESDVLAQIEMEILRFLAQIVMKSWK